MHHLSQFKEITITDTMIELFYPYQGKVRISSPQAGMFHIAFLNVTDWSEEAPEPSVTIEAREFYRLQVEELDNELLISLVDGEVKEKAIVQKEPFSVRFLNENNEEVAHSPQGLSYQYDVWRVRKSFQLHEDELIYRLGESDIEQQSISINHRDTIRPLWNEHLPVPSRLMIPVLYSSKGYGMFIDNTWVGRCVVL